MSEEEQSLCPCGCALSDREKTAERTRAGIRAAIAPALLYLRAASLLGMPYAAGNAIRDRCNIIDAATKAPRKGAP